MRTLHRGLDVSRSLERQETELLKQAAAKLPPPTLLDLALRHIGQTRLELEAQLDEAQETCRRLREEIEWLDQQRDQLLREAAAEKR